MFRGLKKEKPLNPHGFRVTTADRPEHTGDVPLLFRFGCRMVPPLKFKGSPASLPGHWPEASSSPTKGEIWRGFGHHNTDKTTKN